MLPTLLCALALGAADPHSYANFEQVRVRELKLDLDVSFESRQLSGFAELRLEWADPAARSLHLDTRDLAISQIYGIDADAKYTPLRYTLAPASPLFGSKLSVRFPQQWTRVRIHYRTSPAASGLQWLSPEQTLGKTEPFLFSQSQAIHARSWIPLQDTPSVRFPYSAHIRTPKGLLARMSADNRADDAPDGDYQFRMPQAIPSYLMALAVGRLEFRELGPRSGVYAEPGRIEAAAKELVDTEEMIALTEKMFGPYRWGRYDLLVLPPSFPFGGMENPRLTFLTPTFIAGDRSLVSLIAHELAHSWSGNLVTNATWASFWLNEGFTTYVQSRIVEAKFGSERERMETMLSERDLRAELKDLPAADQRLRLDLVGRDPDEGLTAVAYDKGHWFLRWLEEKFGRARFDVFLRGWFDEHAFQSVTTDDFLKYLRAKLLEPNPGLVSEADLLTWLDAPGIPAFARPAVAAKFSAVDSARARWLKSGNADALPAKNWSSQEWLYFLNALEAPGAEVMAKLDAAFALTKTGNNEIAHAWFKLAIANNYRAADAALERYLLSIGRRKLIVPLYEELLKSQRGSATAKRIYAQARPGYHPITQGTLDATFKKVNGPSG